MESSASPPVKRNRREHSPAATFTPIKYSALSSLPSRSPQLINSSTTVNSKGEYNSNTRQIETWWDDKLERAVRSSGSAAEAALVAAVTQNIHDWCKTYAESMKSASTTQSWTRWRVESSWQIKARVQSCPFYELKPWSLERSAEFYENDVYIAIHTMETQDTEVMAYHIFGWVGHGAKHDQESVAAHCLIQLADEVEAATASKRVNVYWEQQENESDVLLDTVLASTKAPLQILKGGQAVLQPTQTTPDTIPKLLRAADGASKCMAQLACAWNSLDSVSSFVLETHGAIYCFHSAHSMPAAKHTAQLTAAQISTHQMKPVLVVTQREIIDVENMSEHADDFCRLLQRRGRDLKGDFVCCCRCVACKLRQNILIADPKSLERKLAAFVSARYVWLK